MSLQSYRLPLPISHIVDDRFVIRDVPRGGGFGLTYRALDQETGAIVALKEYYPPGEAHRSPNGVDLVFHQEFDLRGFQQEIKALSRCPSHPGIAQFVAANVSHGTGYLALEWIDGDILTRQSDPDDEQLECWFIQLIEIILHLAQENLAHRDIKPDNIMIRPDGSVVLVDLGAARIVAGGATLAPHSVIITPQYAAPEQFTQRGGQGVWTDIFGLCATFYHIIGKKTLVRTRSGKNNYLAFDGLEPPLYSRFLDDDPVLLGRNPRLLEAVDLGRRRDPSKRPRGGIPFLQKLGISEKDIGKFLPSSWLDQALITQPEQSLPYGFDSHLHPRKSEKSNSFQRYQTVLIQSLDSARFQASSFQTRHGLLDNTSEQKIALARTEVFINLMFGREIVLPAGHIADSEAIFSILGEMLGLYIDRYRDRIDQACEADRLPRWRPFRLALEDRTNREGYIGFVRRYKYTGASLPLLQAADRERELEFEELKRAGVEKVRTLFLDSDYEGLETAVGRPGYGSYALRAAEYFDYESSLFSVTDGSIEDVTGYAKVFQRHLDNDYVAGAGVADAKAKLPLVEKIQRDLAQFIELGVEGATGFRGNWYVYGPMFEDVWPLARGYLDAKLYLALAVQYDIDHPVLISQALEYGRFDHSLILGPRFGEGMTEQPKLDYGLQRLTTALAGYLPWEHLFELYLDGRFRFSLKVLNRAYEELKYSAYESNKLKDYRFALEGHAATIARSLPEVQFDDGSGRLSVCASNSKSARLMFDTYDANLEATHNGSRLSENGSSVMPAYGVSRFDSAGINLLPLHHELMEVSDGEPTLIHYFIRPIQLKRY